MRTLLLLVITASAVAGAAAANTSTRPLGPLCTGLAKSIGIDQSLVAAFIPQLPNPPTAAICPYLASQSDGGCSFITLVEYALLNDSSNITCSATNGTGDQVVPVGKLTPLQDERPLPAEFADAPAMFKAEGETYYWLFRTAINGVFYAPCVEGGAFCGNCTGTALALPQGWTVHSMANVTHPGGMPLPFLFVLQNNETNQVALVSRGTMGSYEWLQDLKYNYTEAPDVVKMFGGPMEFGFASLFQELWPTARAALDELVVNASTTPEVFVSGESLGGAMATLVSYASQQYINEQMGAKAPNISAVMFSPPNVGNSDFAARFNKLVNARRVAFANDFVPQVPCAPEFAACPAKPAGILGTFGIQGVGTNQNNVSSYAYSPVGGSLMFNASDMPQDTAAWEDPAITNTLDLCWAFTYMDASPRPSYNCYLSSFAPETVDNNWCWLSQKPADATGSYCQGRFPVTNFLEGSAFAPAPEGAAAAPASSTTPAAKTMPAAEAPAPAAAGSTAALSTSAAPRLAAGPLPALLLALLAACLVL